MDNPSPDRPIVITGCQRSGTTLARSLLANHGSLKVYPREPQFITGLHQHFGTKIKSIDKALRYLTSHKSIDGALETKIVRREFAGCDGIALSAFIRIYFNLWKRHFAGEKRIVIKLPVLACKIDLLKCLFADWAIVNVVRDPRGCISSQRARWPHLSLYECSQLWIDSIQNVDNNRSSFKGGVIELRYDELLLNPVNSMRSLCSNLQLSFSEGLLNISLSTKKYGDTSGPRKVTHRSIDPSIAHRWQTLLSAEAIDFIEFHCRKEMTKLGFEISTGIVNRPRYLKSYVMNCIKGYILITMKNTKTFGRIVLWRLRNSMI